MILKVQTPGWGFVDADVGKSVKVTSFDSWFGEPGVLCEPITFMETKGTLVCGLQSFLPEGCSDGEKKSLERAIRDYFFQNNLSEEECRSHYCECDVGNCNTGRLGKPKSPLKSDGGSSLYYDLPIPQKLLGTLIERSELGSCYIKTEEIITHLLANSFDYGNLFKSLVRCKGLQDGTGGKAGNSVDYECNKMKYSVEKIREMKCA